VLGIDARVLQTGTNTKEGIFAMTHSTRMQGLLARILPVLLALIVSGCAVTGQSPDTTVEPPPVVAEPAPTKKIQPKPQIPAVPVPQVLGSRTAIVLSARLPAYENVATELGELMEDYSVYDLEDRSLTPREMFASIDEVETDIVIAIGLRAAIVAKSWSKVPVVFCQVFNITENELTSGQMKGVAALPPLSLQVEAWQQLNPGMKNIGAIIGTGHDSLIAEASRAAESAGMALDHRIARSDRETLYLFNRLTPAIEGFWLFPDNRILSPAVLRQMLNYASRHQVQVAVFNPALLELGATLSATSVESDVAATVVSVARRIVDGQSNAIPDVTPLSEIDIQTNRSVRLDLASANAASGADDRDNL
jgi:ABC-type uncharacterized transport system substrate-binding protein